MFTKKNYNKNEIIFHSEMTKKKERKIKKINDENDQNINFNVSFP